MTNYGYFNLHELLIEICFANRQYYISQAEHLIIKLKKKQNMKLNIEKCDDGWKRHTHEYVREKKLGVEGDN